MEKDIVLQMQNISKRFLGVTALDRVNFTLRKKETHALIGQNGAGKSTLIKILAGIYPKDGGKIFLDGKQIEISSSTVAQKLGLDFIHQELNLVPYFDAFENVILGLPYPKNKLGLIHWGELRKRVQRVAKLLDIEFELKKPVNELSASQRRMVMIARALVHKAKIIVMDESTAALSRNEIEILFKLIKKLKKQGVSIIYISHRLEEIFTIADRVTVMRDGQNVGSFLVKDVDFEKLISLMLKKSLKEEYPKVAVDVGEPVFRVRDLTRLGAVEEIGFDLRKGEILGITGLLGSGKSELARVLFGIDSKDKGDIFFEDKALSIHSAHDAILNGIVLIPEERREQGLVINMDIKENITLPDLKKYQLFKGLGLLSSQKEVKTTKKFIDSLAIRTRGPKQQVGFLSGGNQQKVVLAKWLAGNSKIIIFDEPTRGIDVGSKTEIYKLIGRLAARGAGIILLTSEIDEIMGICDRVLVLVEGRVTKEFKVNETSSQQILNACYGKI